MGKISGPYSFFCQKRSAKKISAGKFLEFSDFKPEKIPENSDYGKSVRGGSTTGERVSCLTNTFFSNFRANFFWIFQLSIQKFSGFSNFAPKIFRARELSIRKILGGKNFSVGVPGPIGRTGFYAG